MSAPAPPPSGWRCELCGLNPPDVAELLDHLEQAHGIEPKFEHWSDGELVIDDIAVLTPEDFTR